MAVRRAPYSAARPALMRRLAELEEPIALVTLAEELDMKYTTAYTALRRPVVMGWVSVTPGVRPPGSGRGKQPHLYLITDTGRTAVSNNLSLED